ncbi:MAG TPA: 50S ribosomal protein L11 methyltransferase [Stellaceae bacterium]|jgi:ribosomal protein L11 methyltransferase|nr:50S ribosomal protein L11 methyltransferase [Stellaceae bacterium]
MTGPLRIAGEIEGADAALAVAAALDEVAGAVAAFETREDEPALWRVEAYPRDRLLDTAFEVRLRLVAAGAGGRILAISEERLPERDWLAENRRAFPPMRIGRFLVHGSHWPGLGTETGPPGAVPIEIDAATAFGTGEHPSTRGCLLALDSLARRRRYRRPLDIGTGSGVLAIAAAKSLHRTVLASDIDGNSARVAAHHVRRNGLAGRVRVVCSPGYRSRALRGAKYDLIFANILARPLALMARDLARAIAPGGVAVLAGLLRRQEALVVAAHRVQGLALKRRLQIEGWSTLIMQSGIMQSEITPSD